MGDESNGPKRALLDAATEIAVLVLELPWADPARLPETLRRLLSSRQTQQAIEAVLAGMALDLLASKGAAPAGGSRGKAPPIDLRAASYTAAAAVLEREMAQAPQTKQLQTELKKALENFKNSPVGVWLDREKKLVYIVGPLLALAGGAVLYGTKKGDAVAKLAQGKSFTVKEGTLEMTGKITAFKPSKQTVGGSLAFGAKLEAVEVELTILGGVVGGAAQAGAEGNLVVPLTGPLSAVVSGQIGTADLPDGEPPPLLPEKPKPGWNRYHYKLAAGLKVEGNGLKVQLLGVVENNAPAANLTIDYERTLGRMKLTTGGEVTEGPGSFAGQGTLGISGAGKDPWWKVKVGAGMQQEGGREAHKLDISSVFTF